MDKKSHEKTEDSKRRMWRRIFIAGAVLAAAGIVIPLAAEIISSAGRITTGMGIIGGAGGPTMEFIINQALRRVPTLPQLVIFVVSVIGIVKTK